MPWASLLGGNTSRFLCEKSQKYKERNHTFFPKKAVHRTGYCKRCITRRRV